MNNAEVKQIISKYNKKRKTIVTLSIIIFVLILLLKIDLWIKLLLAPCLLFAAVVFEYRLKIKYIEPILYEELNPQKYYMAIYGTNIAQENCYDELTSALHMGDYNTVINICNLKLKDKKFAKYSYVYYSYIARVYFDLGDNNKLKDTCDKLEKALSDIKPRKRAEALNKAYGPRIEFYKKYLDEDYSGCKNLLWTTNINKPANSTKFETITNTYLYAVACYKLGETEEAKNKFEYIINEAPLMHCSEISRKYISAIENNADVITDEYNIRIEEDYTLPQRKPVEISKSKAFIVLFSIIIITVGIVYTSIIDTPTTPEKILKRTNNMTEIVATYEMENGDMLCFYDTKYEGYSFSYLKHVKKSKYQEGFTINDINCEYYYTLGIPKKDKLVEFSIYSDINEAPNEAYLSKEFLYNKKVMLFCITSIENKDLKFYHTSIASKNDPI